VDGVRLLSHPALVDVSEVEGDRWALDRATYRPGDPTGHYESFYQRGNHPDRPLAFWIRYTVFVPAADPGSAEGELWAVAFDGETGEHTVAHVSVPMSECAFSPDRFDVRVGTADLGPGRLAGTAGNVAWELRYDGDAPPVLLLPPRMYAGGFPKAKSLVPLPLARWTGSYSVGDRTVDVDGWLGSQNHNWGSRHTDRYAFGQVAGFDDAPDVFLEVATVKATIAGPMTTPWLTTLVLREGAREHALVSPRTAVRAVASYRWFDWVFSSRADGVEVRGRIRADRADVVGLRYRDPPGGEKACLNTKIGRAVVRVRDAAGERTYRARHRALLEILTSRTDHGVPLHGGAG